MTSVPKVAANPTTKELSIAVLLGIISPGASHTMTWFAHHYGPQMGLTAKGSAGSLTDYPITPIAGRAVRFY
jgi:hypothetical protein